MMFWISTDGMHWLDEEPSRTDFNYSGSMNVTIAVAKEDTNWIIRPFDLRKICLGKWKGCWNYLNRYIELENGNMSILGFHVNCNNNEQWEKIHLVAKNSEFTFIVGDFNVNDFLYPSQDALKQLETNYDRLDKKIDQFAEQELRAYLLMNYINARLCGEFIDKKEDEFTEILLFWKSQGWYERTKIDRMLDDFEKFYAEIKEI